MRGSVLVIGSGISGMRAASELVQQGFKVFLLERRPTIGGTMAQIDKMYPSNECATCTQLPRMLELTSDQNVVVLAFAELESVQACEGGFKVGVEKKVRYVDPLKCNACTECFAACPVSGVPMEFNLGRGTSKAIRFWSPFPPRKALIDPETCTYIKEGKCGGGTEPLCQKACEPGAVDFSQKPAKVEIEVGSIIVATGAEEERSDLLRRLGHGRLSNVLTSLEYERLLSGLGPTGGVVRSDDGSAPSRVAWIVAEDFDGGARISSSVALMTAASEALGTLERNPAAEVTVISGRTEVGGRRERQFLAEAEKRGVRVERTSSAAVTEEPGEGLSVGVDGEKRIPADLVVITPRLVPPPGFQELARTLEIEPDGDGLPLPGPSSKHPIHTSREGVFICGAATRSMGIQESVVQACAAAAAAAARLAKGRGTETAPPPAPELLDVKPADEPQIAVVICRCGMNIAGALDVQELADYVAGLPRVAHVGITPFGCDGIMIKELISSGEYNRIVVGACSPRTHEPLFQMIAEAGGLNRHLLEIVNLRNHCTWVHAREGKEAVLRKAKRLLRMGVARAALLEPLQAKELPVTQGCLVLGGTPAGIACAAALGRMGFAAHLVIAGDEPGSAFPEKIRAVAARALETVRDDPAVTVHPRSAASAIAGFVGNYTATIRNAEGEQEVAVGAVVVATKEAMGVTEGFEQALYLARDEDGFLVSALGNLNTLDSTTDGVFLCGDARDEVSALSSFISGEAAASRAACILAHPSLTTSPVISRVVDENCDGCAYCVEPCPAHAITLIEYRRGGEIKKTVDINEALCKGCGSCMATCPKRGAHVRNFSPDHFSAMVNALLEAS